MRGDILTYDASTGSGQISGEDGQRYNFTQADVQGGAALAAGARADFVPEGDNATQIVVLSATPASAYGQAGHAPMPGEKPYDFKSAMLNFNGRLRRQHFWISWLILMGVSVVLGWIPLLGTIISLALIWPNLAIQVQRLHDMGKSGWLVLIPIAGAIIGSIMIIGSVGTAIFTNPQGFENEDPTVMLSMLGSMMGGFAVMALVCLGFLLWIGLSEGQKGDNKFGPDPLA